MFSEVRFLIRSCVGKSRLGFQFLRFFILHKRRRKLLVNKKTEVCIEGFPRCANTFSVLAFENAQDRKFSIAHHTHLAGQVLCAVQKNIPIIVLVREPLDACVSLLLREPHLSAGLSLKLYLDFHRPLVPYLDRLICASFKQVTEDYAAIIQRMNTFYGTEFGTYQNSPEADRKVFDQMSKMPSRENNLTVSRPTKEKQMKRDEIIELFQTDRCKYLLDKCIDVYSKFINVAV